IGEELQPRKRTVLFAGIVWISDAADVCYSISFAGQSHRLGHGKARARNHKHGVLFVGIAGDTIFTAARRIDELDFDARTYARQVTIEPTLEWISRGRAASFRRVAVIGAAGRVRLHFVGFAPGDVDTAT